MFEGGSFDSKTVALLSEVFETLVAELDLRDIADREKAAKIIIRLAKGQAILDEERLRGVVRAR
jgi:hypothetical protein